MAVSPTASSGGDTRNRGCFAVVILPLLLELNLSPTTIPGKQGDVNFIHARRISHRSSLRM
jgi:hypothetical protein